MFVQLNENRFWSILIFFAGGGLVQRVAPRQTYLRLSNVQCCFRNCGISFEKYLLKQVWQLFSTNLPNLRFLCTFSSLRSALGFCRRSSPRKEEGRYYKPYNSYNANFSSEVVRCGALQKKHLRDSTKRTARRCLLLGMCHRLRLITRNYSALQG